MPKGWSREADLELDLFITSTDDDFETWGQCLQDGTDGSNLRRHMLMQGWNVEVQDKPCVAVKDFEVKDQELIEMVRDQEVSRHDTDKASFLSSSRDSANSTGATCKHIE